MQTSFRKSVALVDEPSVCVAHFQSLLNQTMDKSPKNLAERLRFARQIYIATWTIFVWCRDIENLESGYRCSALALLYVWDLSHAHYGGQSKAAKGLMDVTNKMIQLSHIIGAAYIEEHIEPFSAIEDGLAVSVPSNSSVDINLKLFDSLGRVAIHGLWLFNSKNIVAIDDESQKAIADELQKCAAILCNMIINNQSLYTPLRDDHAIEITLAGLFLKECDAYDFLSDWVKQITFSSIFSYRSGGSYPCVFREYSELALHPQSTEGYQEDATIGSILYPSLGVWLAICNDKQTFENLADFHKNDMSHSTWQLWLPDEITDENLYQNSDIHGACLTNVDTAGGIEGLLAQINKEIDASTAFNELSSIRFNLWPLVLIACQTYRLPVPPHFWSMSVEESQP
uniref:Uncharacterized protein n=1 Tax=uncultured Thiotrichaceae bacterium TaxID=298394 RepID=A0A6S6UG05_9GAMM|nr:MAG: Unknown protein [uncultured Thiotrichaceae bacterium]